MANREHFESTDTGQLPGKRAIWLIAIGASLAVNVLLVAGAFQLYDVLVAHWGPVILPLTLLAIGVLIAVFNGARALRALRTGLSRGVLVPASIAEVQMLIIGGRRSDVTGTVQVLRILR